MTLILDQASTDYVLQVTDRLVTQATSPFDPLANKNIVYCARNALVTIGYTGFAFLGGIPTDQWLVEQLTGNAFDRDHRPPDFTMNRRAPWLDLGMSVRLLKERLDAAPATGIPSMWAKQWVDQSFDLCILGWQWKRGRARPIIEALNKPRGSLAFSIERRPRYWYWERRTLNDGSLGIIKFSVRAAPRENISRADLQDLVARLQDGSYDAAETELVRTVRQVALHVPQVGPDCISILIAPPTIGQARVRFLPLNSHEAILQTASQNRRLTVAYTPWFVGPNLIVAPSLLAGPAKTEFSLGPYQIHLEGVGDSGGLLALHFGQERPKAP